MKKALLIVTVFLLFLHSASAQIGTCAGITVTAFPLNPQSGAYNYFGVSVTLDHVYDQNVTVTGYIYADDNHTDQSNPFSVTVTSGNLSNQTSSTFFQTGPTSDGNINVASISPSQITHNSVSYSTQCSINGYPSITVIINDNNAFEYMGSQHNSGVVAALPNITLTSSTLNSDILTQVKSWGSGLGYNTTDMQNFYDGQVTAGYLPFDNILRLDSLGNALASNSVITSTANFYVQRIYTIGSVFLSLDYGDATSYSNFSTAMISLEDSINNDGSLSSSEKNGLLSACSVGRFSAAYWGDVLLSSPLTRTHDFGTNETSIVAYQPMPSKVSRTYESFTERNDLFENNLENSILIQAPVLDFLQTSQNYNLNYPLFKIKLPKWLRIVISDVGGAIIGITGGAAGIITGAVGTSIATFATLD